ncbi:MAG: hypothetical protein NC903_03160, partial [Candidatus Omnitrophica bacterium]|nr:hypothetical protein [Candidatus Omnitrophota bacterium]
MLKNIYLLFISLSLLMIFNFGWSAEIQMGETKFQGTVSVYEDGTVETNFPEKEVEVGGEGRKRVKIKFMEGRFALVDSATNEEMTLDREGKFIKKSRLMALQISQSSGGIPTTPKTSPLPVASPSEPQKPNEEKTPESEKKEPIIDISILDVVLSAQIFVGQQTNIEVVILNDSEVRLDGCLLIVNIEDGFRDKKIVNLNSRQRQREIFRWLPRREGRFRIIATLKAPEEFEEKNTRNNAKTT